MSQTPYHFSGIMKDQLRLVPEGLTSETDTFRQESGLADRAIDRAASGLEIIFSGKDSKIYDIPMQEE